MIQNESIVKSDKDDIEDNVSVIGLKIIEKEKEKLKDIYYNFDAITDNQTNRANNLKNEDSELLFKNNNIVLKMEKKEKNNKKKIKMKKLIIKNNNEE